MQNLKQKEKKKTSEKEVRFVITRGRELGGGGIG